ncbi:N-acetylmuramoyl-L-alanine amidase [Bacillus subtilis]|uniref:N-acetylmuramoyl-L-alanine amidase n=1 Tax=Bacillus subtilis TaxID=1423 RepID=UPI000FF8F1F4|nr:N-acetylmuramoyl-L-alanine amidase [Bacillus subtilis]MEC1264208.1 N-acetylmuramoyl-L-alanine amidase [Bacillus subtilis]QAR60556.1 N-acetylmuramoyl-L-alanine amidase [Bacillus subtilis]
MPNIVLDAGHGGNDSGATGNGLIEKNLTLDLVLKVEQHLKTKQSVIVHLTRNTDEFVSLNKRSQIANKLNSNLFVSLHHNAGGGTGFESYIYPGLKDTITGQIQQEMHKDIINFLKLQGMTDRGQREANFAVLRQTKMPAILLENLFLDSKKDASLLKKPTFIEELSQTMANSIASIATNL